MQGVQVFASLNILSTEPWIYARCTGTWILEYTEFRIMNICKVYRYLRLGICSAQNHEYMQGVQVLASWNILSTEPWIYARYTGTCGLKYAQHRTMNICKVYRYLRLEICSAQNHEYMQGVQVLASRNILSLEPWIYASCIDTCTEPWIYARYMQLEIWFSNAVWQNTSVSVLTWFTSAQYV